MHYQRRGFKSAIVCADTFRAGAFDQTRQSATKAKVAYFGSYTETDPVAIAAEGVTKFKKERFDVIIVDTSGRHRQESELFQEMVQISKAVAPDMTVLVLDASIGKVIYLRSVDLLLVLTKIPRPGRRSAEQSIQGERRFWRDYRHEDGRSCERGRRDIRVSRASIAKCLVLTYYSVSLDRVAATKTPIIFLGVGEHLNDLERFSPEPFISKLLGMGDVQGLMEHMQSMAMANPERHKDIAKNIEEGKLTIRDWREQLSNIMGMCDIFIPITRYLLTLTYALQGFIKQNSVYDSRNSSRFGSRQRRRCVSAA